jgi:RNA polymerase sigma factor for flagellar operon FliA
MGSNTQKKAQTPSIEQDYVSEYGPLVKRIAHHLIARLPSSVLAEDLIQAGMIGLIEASRNFNPTKGASFSTYAGIRIRGAMLDEMRKGDWAPRSVHRNTRKVQKAIREIENKTGRDAKDMEVAELMGLTIKEYHSILQDTKGAKIFTFEEIGLDDDILSSTTTIALMGPLEKLQKENFCEVLALEIAKLPERERLVLALYYDEELNLREVGEILNVSESRISQIHSQAMIRLQARMQEWKTVE